MSSTPPNEDLPPERKSAGDSGSPEEIRRRSARIRANRADVDIMILKNREERRSTGRDFYAGYRLLRTAAEPVPEELPYVGAFLPLDVAHRHSELLGLPTLHYQTVYRDEKLPRATKIIGAPGKFDEWTGHAKISCQLVILLCAVISAAIYAAVALWPGR
jgi:hypothetical protein